MANPVVIEHTTFTATLVQASHDLATLQRFNRSNALSPSAREQVEGAADRLRSLLGIVPISSLRDVEAIAIERLVAPFEGVRR